MYAKKNQFTRLALCWLLLMLSDPLSFAQIEQKVDEKVGSGKKREFRRSCYRQK
jgi:hypothetical protein